MKRVTLVGMLKMELPGQTVTLCDGGFVPWNGDTYRSSHPVFGTVAGFESLTEGVGDEAPAGKIVFLPPSLAAAVALSQPGYQGARVRMWIAEIDEATGRPLGQPDQMADWQTDKTVLRRGSGTRALDIVCVTRSQRLMVRNDGNALSTAAHQRTYPGERGHDNAVGMESVIAWGVDSPPRVVQQV